MHKVDPLNILELADYVFDNSADQFKSDFYDQIKEICSSISSCYISFLQFENHSEPDERFMHLTAHIFALVDALYISVRLLAHGFLSSSGNQFRVALEALAISVLMSHPGDILVDNNHKNFYNDFLKDKPWTKPHRAIANVNNNREQLGFSINAMNLLITLKDLYNNYSHASRLSIRTKILSPDRVLFGGGYEHDQKELFSKELEIRNRFLIKVPSFLDTLYNIVA